MEAAKEKRMTLLTVLSSSASGSSMHIAHCASSECEASPPLERTSAADALEALFLGMAPLRSKVESRALGWVGKK